MNRAQLEYNILMSAEQKSNFEHKWMLDGFLVFMATTIGIPGFVYLIDGAMKANIGEMATGAAILIPDIAALLLIESKIVPVDSSK